MKKLFFNILFILAAISISLNAKCKTMNKSNKKVTGIGGVFFKSKDPDKLNEWYKTHLGLETTKYGMSFEWRYADDATRKGLTQWNPFKESTKYFEPSTSSFMINYRVENIEALVDQLKKDGVTIIDKIEGSDYGKFVHIMDLEGNKIELWEPIDEIDKTAEANTAAKNDKKVTGIGGVFFKSKDPDKLNEWYKTHLGLETTKYGTSFEWRHADDSSKKGLTQWNPFKETTKYFEPSTGSFMINYRVGNMEALLEQLKKDGVTITDTIEDTEYGKFVHIMDLEGNKIELWEPKD